MTYPDLARVTTRELHALEEGDRIELSAQLAETERIFLDVVERGTRLGEFHVAVPALAVAAIGAMGIRAAEPRMADSPFTPEQVAEAYSDFAVKLLS
jgi:hypothetical protein